LRVTDEFGAEATATTTRTIHNLAPSFVDAGVPYGPINPGEPLHLMGSASDPDDTFLEDLAYSWNLNQDAVFGHVVLWRT
jgi:hypothetical protein